MQKYHTLQLPVINYLDIMIVKIRFYLMKVDANRIWKGCPTYDWFGTGQKQSVMIQIVLNQN